VPASDSIILILALYKFIYLLTYLLLATDMRWCGRLYHSFFQNAKV